MKKINSMALFNGVLFKNDKRQVITTINDNDIKCEVDNINNNKITKLPFIRGFASLIYSFKNILNSIKENIKINNIYITLGYILAFMLFLTTYIVFPIIISNLVETYVYKVLIQLFMQIAIFTIYMLSIINTKYIKKLLIYHSSKHTIINFYNKKYEEISRYKSILDIDLNEIKKYSKFDKRCTLNHIMIIFILTLITGVIIPNTNTINSIILETISIPLLITIGFEILVLTTKFTSFSYSFIQRFMIIQNITTMKPNDNSLMLSSISLLEVLNIDHISLKEYIKEYLYKYDIKDYEIADIYNLIEYKLGYNYGEIINEDIKLGFVSQYELEILFNKYYIDKIPLAYITGYKYLYKEKYIVNENVLIPRSDTEILIENAINIINKNNFKTCLDLCTGSGCVGISISKNSNIEQVLLSDISDKALEVTKSNIDLNNANKCDIIQSDLFNNINKEFDVIVSNPPYITTKEMLELDDYVIKEPKSALEAGIKGLDIYTKILNECKIYLKNDGYILFEIGYNQNKDMINLIKNYDYIKYVETIKDYNNNDRVVVCRLHLV